MLQYLENLFRAFDFESLQSVLLRMVAVFLCLTIHELSHGVAAYLQGDPTAKSRHRLSLNPLHHIDWIGLLMMFSVGFGWAKPVPVDPRYFRKPKQGMAITALAGPASNFLLTLVALLSCKVIVLFDHYGTAAVLVFDFLLYTVAPLSLGLGLFNLLPIPPLDGSKVLAMFLPDRAYLQLMRYERYGILLLLALSYFNVIGGFVSKLIVCIFNWLIVLIF